MPRALLLFALLTACRDAPPAPPAPAPPSEARLHGFRALLPDPGGEARPAFDAGSQPVLVVEGAWPEGARLRLGEDALPLQPETRGATTIVRVTLPAAAEDTPGELRLTVGEAPWRAWPVLRMPTPDARPALAALRAEVKALPPAEGAARLEAALPALPPGERLWLAVDVARLRARARPDEAAAAWRAAAQVARQCGVPSEVSRRLRAAASMAIARRAFGEADALLDEAQAADGATWHPAATLRTLALRAYRHKALGDYRRATELLAQAVELAEASGLDADVASTAQPLAVLLQDQGRHRTALALMARAEAWYAANPTAADGGPTFGTNHGWVLLRAMAAGVEPVDHAKLQAKFGAALRAFQKRGDPVGEDMAYADLAEAALAAGDRAEAARLLAEWTSRRKPDRFAALGQPLLQARLRLLEGRPAEALAHFETLERRALAESGGLVSDVVLQARHGAAKALAAMDRLDDARARYDAVIADLRRLARRTGLQGERSPFLAQRHALVEEAVSLSLRAGDAQAAFALADAGHSPALQSLEAQARLDGLDPALRRDWDARLERWLRERDAAEAEGDRLLVASPDERPRLEAELAKRREMLARDFDALHAWLDEATSPPAAPDARGVVGALGPGEGLLAFVRVGGHLRAFEVTPAGVAVGAALPDADPFAGVARFAAGRTHLYVVPGDEPRARDLPETHAEFPITLLPYATWLLEPVAAPAGRPLVVADPNGNLPHAGAEGREVATLLAGRGPVAHLAGAAARRAAVIDALRGTDLFHFAGHGVLAGDSPWDAHLRLADDARLTVADVLVARPALRLAVLSGCETGTALPLSGRESVGLAEAFLLGGARTVLAAARPVDDRKASAVLRAFYASGGPEAPLETLRALRARPDLDREVLAALRVFGRPR